MSEIPAFLTSRIADRQKQIDKLEERLAMLYLQQVQDERAVERMEEE